jgi:hypothetical protein
VQLGLHLIESTHKVGDLRVDLEPGRVLGALGQGAEALSATLGIAQPQLDPTLLVEKRPWSGRRKIGTGLSQEVV